jgi:hypothetical protein
LVLELVGLVSPTTAAAMQGVTSAGGAVGGALGSNASGSGGGGVPDGLRSLAVRVLAVLLQDRMRHTSLIAAINGGVGQGGPGLLAQLLQSAIAAYTSEGARLQQQQQQQQGASQQPQAPGTISASATTAVAAVVPTTAACATAPTAAVGVSTDPEAEYIEVLCGRRGASDGLHDFLEALLNLVSALSLSQQGGQVLGDAGVMQLLLSLLEDTWCVYVCACVRVCARVCMLFAW